MFRGDTIEWPGWPGALVGDPEFEHLPAVDALRFDLGHESREDMMAYPATFEVQTPEEIANWRPLIQWVLAIPHLVLAYLLGTVVLAVAVASWFAIMFTGKLPEGLANVQAMILRYGLRAVAYAGFLHEEYPPFDFTPLSADPGSTPTSASYIPSLEDRNRLTVRLRIFWIIPAMLYAIAIVLVGLVVHFVSFFVVVVTGRWPTGLRAWVVRSWQVSNRYRAYGSLLTDEYPPFSTDISSSEPAS